MVSHFGTDIMRIIDDEPDRLAEVPAGRRDTALAHRLNTS